MGYDLRTKNIMQSCFIELLVPTSNFDPEHKINEQRSVYKMVLNIGR